MRHLFVLLTLVSLGAAALRAECWFACDARTDASTCHGSSAEDAGAIVGAAHGCASHAAPDALTANRPESDPPAATAVAGFAAQGGARPIGVSAAAGCRSDSSPPAARHLALRI